MACLQPVVKLLDRLQLRSFDASNTGDDVVHYVSRLFNKYSTALLTSLETCQPEMVSSSLPNLSIVSTSDFIIRMA